VKKSLKASLGSVVVAGALGAVLIPAMSASATTSQDCQALLTTLRSDTVAAQTSFTNDTDFTGEVAKLDDAATKLTEEKNADAVLKLGDFQATLTSLSTALKPKADLTTAQTLTAEAQGVIDCINAIGIADPTSTPEPTATTDPTSTTGATA
jgi:hypothetical protein